MLSSSYGQKCNIPTYSNSWRRKKGINLPNIPTMCNYVESLAGHNKDLTDTDFAECGWSSKSKLQKLTCMVSNGRKIANKPKITRFLIGEKKIKSNQAFSDCISTSFLTQVSVPSILTAFYIPTSVKSSSGKTVSLALPASLYRVLRSREWISSLRQPIS